jgi:hypothetical protein
MSNTLTHCVFRLRLGPRLHATDDALALRRMVYKYVKAAIRTYPVSPRGLDWIALRT